MVSVPKSFLVLAIFLVALLTTSTTTEGGRDIPSNDEVYDPQNFSAPSPFLDSFSFPPYIPNSTEGTFGYGQWWSPWLWHWNPWIWGIHSVNKDGGRKGHNQEQDAKFLFHHHRGWGFPWVGDIKAEAESKDMANGKYVYGDLPTEADGGKVAGKTP